MSSGSERIGKAECDGGFCARSFTERTAFLLKMFRCSKKETLSLGVVRSRYRR